MLRLVLVTWMDSALTAEDFNFVVDGIVVDEIVEKYWRTSIRSSIEPSSCGDCRHAVTGFDFRLIPVVKYR